MKIKMLNESTVSKIAAGEAIIRPVSVIKELIENAIDAGSSRITVSIENGGKTKMTVTDNGCGIAYNEVPLAFERHATSKILEIEDLQQIHTLGFRGEALASIMAVSRIQITSRSEDEETGSCSIFENGQCIHQRVCGHDRGTVIEVNDLFYNMPVRQKHMGKSGAEAMLIRDMTEKMALSHPEIAFSLYSDSRKLFSTTGSRILKDAIEGIYGRGFFQNLIPLNVDNAPMGLHGYIGNLSAGRSSRDFQIFFVNGRYVRNPALSRAFEEAYEGYLMQHRYPVGIVFIDLPGKMLDVNIHPAKTEIAILNQSLVMILFKQGIRQTLRASDLSVEISEKPEESEKCEAEKQPEKQKDSGIQMTMADASNSNTQSLTVFPLKNEALNQKENDFADLDKIKVVDAVQLENISGFTHSENCPAVADTVLVYGEATSSILPEKNFQPDAAPQFENIRDAGNDEVQSVPKVDFSQCRIIGQLFSTYIILERGSEAWILDQHAAHEAFMYEELRRRFEKKEDFPAQPLLVPVPISVEPRVIQAFDDWSEELLSYGFDCDVFGEDTLMVRSVPVILGEPQDAGLICAFIDARFYQTEPDRGFQIKKIITMACKAAVKGNQTLTIQEIRALLDRLAGLENPFTCPHGRPIIFKLREYDFRKMFKRVV